MGDETRVVVDRVDNGAAEMLEKIKARAGYNVAGTASLAIVLLGMVYTGGRKEQRMIDRLEALAVRDSVALVQMSRHISWGEGREREISGAIAEINTTLTDVVANQRFLREELRRLRDRADR